MKTVMNFNSRFHIAISMFMASTLVLFSCIAMSLFTVSPANAVSMREYNRKLQNNAALRKKLSGVSKKLADKIVELNDLNERQIPNQIRAAEQAQQQSEQARSLVESTNQRLESAKKDKQDLEEKIKQTGADYDDAKAAVAQLARESFHGSSSSHIMAMLTNSTTTEQFVGKLQSDCAVARSESNAAHNAAVTLNNSMNRKQRLEAIEAEIAKLKQKAQDQAKSAEAAAAAARDKQKQLQDLRDQGDAIRKQLESEKSSLKSQQAREAAEIIQMKSAIDAQARALANSPLARLDPRNGNRQQGGRRISLNRPVLQPIPASDGFVNGMDYTVPGNCPEGSGFCYGHNTGNTGGPVTYPARNCTLWAYLRRSQLSLPVATHMGNGADWANTGRRYGYLVNNIPHVGAAMVFPRGAAGSDRMYGHVAIVERVNSDGSVLISEGGVVFSTFPHYRTIQNASRYEFVHY